MLYEQAGFMYEWQKAYGGIQQKESPPVQLWTKGLCYEKKRTGDVMKLRKTGFEGSLPL